MMAQFKQARAAESAYRRGYQQGFDMAAQLLAEGYTAAEIRQHCRRLSRWRYAIPPGEVVDMAMPPELPTRSRP